MTTDELVQALRQVNFTYSDACPCAFEEMCCKGTYCIIIQAADRLEELDRQK